jgi:ABC-type bacteriocin/lantibiotic exporter with double-glycine peptidase domain
MIITLIMLIIAILLMVIFAIPLMLVETLFWLIIVLIGGLAYGFLHLLTKPFKRKKVEETGYY